MKKKNAARSDSLRREYERLSRSLAAVGYISQGSVLDRSTLRPPRSGYQWTRKVARKTTTVALSAEQFQSMRKAIQKPPDAPKNHHQNGKNIAPNTL